MSSDGQGLVLRPAWDVGRTAFKTLELLMGLVKASSQDDVHPQAVLAAEALGAGILVAPVRIKDALQALGANESFRLQQTRISIGLMHGNTQRAIQSSTPLLQFFVFCTAFKLIYVDEAIGDIMFEMMSTTGLLAKHPISPPQLTRLLNQVSAHSDQCVPIDLMHQIASTVAEFSPGPNVYMHMEHQALAKLLTQVFEKMRDEEARSLCLTGHVSSVWIATALLWWFEDDAYLIVGGKLVCGKGDVRLLIVLLPHSSDPWKLEVWRKTEDALKFVFEDPQDEPRYINRLPLKDLINFFDAYQFQLSDADLDGDRRVLIKQTIAELAAALIQIVLENGKITLHRRYKGQEDDDCCAHTNLSTIADLSWSSKSNTLMSNYGWEVHLESKQIRARLSDSLQGKGRLLSSGLPSNAVKTILYDDCNKYIEEKMGDHHMIVDYIRDAAFCIAVDAILTCTTRSSMPDRYVKPLDFDSLGRNKDILVSLLSNGIEAKRFRTLALQQLLPGLPQVDPSSLVLSSNGIVAGLSIVWNGTCDPRDACAIKVMRGAIRHDNMNYTGIREADLLERRFEDSDKCPQLKFDDVGRLGEKFPILQTYPESTDNIAASRKCPASWTDAFDALVTATHSMDVPYFNPAEELQLGLKMKDEIAKRKIRRAEPTSDLATRIKSCLVIDSGGSDLVKMFAAARHMYNEPYHKPCHSLVVHHRGSLLDSMQRACELGYFWILIT